jgi:hypothetical protein
MLIAMHSFNKRYICDDVVSFSASRPWSSGPGGDQRQQEAGHLSDGVSRDGGGVGRRLRLAVLRLLHALHIPGQLFGPCCFKFLFWNDYPRPVHL